MPTYTVRDPRSNRTVRLTGDSPPTEQELHQIFAQMASGPRAPESRRRVLPPGGPADETAPAWVDRGVAGMEYLPNGFTGGNPELNRPDNSLLGLPPELAVLSGAGIARAAGTGLSAAGKAVAGAKAAAGQAGTALKYEATKSGLEAMGVPTAVAIPIAISVSGYTGRAAAKPRAPRQAKTTPTEAAAPASPPASSPAAAAPQTQAAPPPAAPAAPSAPRSSGAQTLELPPSARTRGQMSPQWIQNDLAVAARRANVKLTEPEFRQAETLVRQGQSPVEAVASVKGGATPTPPAPSTTKPKMSAAETREYTKLRRAGKTHEEASQMLESQRALTQTLGTTPVGQMDKAVRQRQRTGRWGDERK
jgi:hypothetical protein